MLEVNNQIVFPALPQFRTFSDCCLSFCLGVLRLDFYLVLTRVGHLSLLHCYFLEKLSVSLP